MNILAIDPATTCGWASSDGPSGVWDLSVRPDESKGMRLIRLRSKLREFQKVELIVFEASRNVRHGNAIRVAAQLQGVIETHCCDEGIEYKGYSPSEIKKFATGNGLANKTLMMTTGQAKWPEMDFIDDNHVDAVWLLELARKEFGT